MVVIGGSSGSLKPLLDLAGALPADLPGSVAVTIHVGAQARSRLPWLLSRRGQLPTVHATPGEQLQPGRVYVAPPGCHLLLPGGVAELSSGPRINRHRPAVDAMFASAARWFGDRVVAVVLSGSLDDGAVGAALVARAGGVVLVQEPDEADQPSMPRAALAAAPGAIAVKGAALGEMVSGMLGESGLATWPRQPPVAGEVSMEVGGDLQFLSPGESRLTRLAWPECGGALAETVLPRISYYRCHVGHQFGPRSLAAAQAVSAEAKLWAAVATLEGQTAALAQHLAGHTDLDQDAAEQQSRAADRAGRLADSLRAQIRETPGT